MTSPAPAADTPKKPRHHPQSSHARILKLLQKQGSATNRQLNVIAFRFGARIHDLRREGHIIRTEREHDGLFRFYYVGPRDQDGD